jgi:hypothetical protein
MPTIFVSIKRFIAALLLTLVIITAATGVYCYRYQDRIIQAFLDEANKRLSNVVQIGNIQLTFFKSFPNISLALHDVVVKDRRIGSADLLTARNVYLAFDLWQLLRGHYELAHLSLEHGKLCLAEDPAAQLGWETAAPKTATQRAVSLTVNLQKISLKEMEVVYGHKEHHYTLHKMQASLHWEGTNLESALQGTVTIRGLRIHDLCFAQDLPITLNAALGYDHRHQTWRLHPTQLSHGRSLLRVQGNGSLAAPAIAITLQGEKLAPQFLINCLPQQYAKKAAAYNPQGELAVKLSIQQRQGDPYALKGSFVLDNGAFTTSQCSKPITLRKLSGNAAIPNMQDLKTATLKVDEVAAAFADSTLEGSFTLSDFHNLHLQCAANALVHLAPLNKAMVKSAIADASGSLAIAWKLEANLNQLLQGESGKEHMFLSGTLQAKKVQFRMANAQLLCKDLVGNLVFQDNALVVKKLSGTLGPGDFSLSGHVENLLPALLSDRQVLYANGKLYADYVDLDALLGGEQEAAGKSGTKATAPFTIPPRLVLGLDCDIQQLHCRRFQAKNVRGRVKVKAQKLVAEKLQLSFAGGKATIAGVLDASNEDLTIQTSAQLQAVQLPKLFYAFENFHQTFLMERHLRGEVFSDFSLTMRADRQWRINWDSFLAEIDVQLHNGVLHNFEPLQKLAKYVAEEKLADLRFSELKNHITIKKRTIHLPPMEVHSSLTRIQVAGTHTFDGKIDYHLTVPLADFREEKEGGLPEVVTANALAGINLFLKLSGDTQNYTISYDAGALKERLKKGLKEQGKALMDIITGEYEEQQQKPQALEKDDYFAFD